MLKSTLVLKANSYTDNALIKPIYVLFMFYSTLKRAG